MATSDKRARAYDFVSMAEDEFEWEDEDETDDPDTDADEDTDERHIVGYDEDGDPILELGPDEPGQVPAQDE